MNKTDTITNSTLKRSSTYIYAPLSYDIKVALACLSVISGLVSFLGNSLLLYFTYQKRNIVHAQAFNRQPLFDCYITSLALTDVLCALISLPIFTAELFVDFIKTDLICAIARYVTMFFPIATVFNYLVISRERYLAIHKPFNLPSVRKGMKLVVVAWLVAAIVDAIPRPSYKLVRYDLGDNMYTHTCKYDNSTQTSRVFFLTFSLVIWVLPCIYLSISSALTLAYLLKSQNQSVNVNGAVSIETARKYNTTKLFIHLIFAFLIPYMVFVVYGGVVMVFKIELSFTADCFARYLITMGFYANGAAGASILFYSSRYHNRKLFEMFRKMFRIGA